MFILHRIGEMVPVYHLNYIYYCDYFVQNSGNRYSVRGGYSNNALYCGIFYIAINTAVSYTNWGIGASISFKLYLLL